MAAVREIELLAPARDADIARQAIMHGADAVYIGGPSHGARASATNSIDDIARLSRLAHLYGAKVYVTLNTIIYDDELAAVERDIHELYQAGVDALIVQDMGLLRMPLPSIDLHASTQCDIRTVEKARFLADLGFSQLVLPREMSLEQIRAVSQAVGPETRLEAFVHGALCVSYSGDCQASCAACGRSANRGECAQMCRMAYTLTDGDGRAVVRDKHLLSLRDLCRLDHVGALIDAGVSSLKIEGRLKDAAYVKTTVAAYRRAIDQVIAASGGRYRRSSWGRSQMDFEADVRKVFNRGFTRYFIDGRPAAGVSMANIDTPKWMGERVGRVKTVDARTITAHLSTRLNNGDGLGYYDREGRYNGFRVNRAEGSRLSTTTPVDIAPGTTLYRNRDTRYDALMAQPTAQRLIDVEMTLSAESPGTLTLRATAECGITASVEAPATIDSARTPQREGRRRVLGKLGTSPLRLAKLDDRLDDNVFIPASQLTGLRQQLTQALTEAIVSGHRRRERLPEKPGAHVPQTHLTYHDNVANRLAEELYRSHGATEIDRALEVDAGARRSPQVVMTTRYCLRRELGACLLTPEGRSLKGPLRISNDAATYRLDFDCQRCQMHLCSEPRDANNKS